MTLETKNVLNVPWEQAIASSLCIYARFARTRYVSSLTKCVPREDFSGIRVWAITRASGISSKRNFISGNEYKEAVERRGFARVEASKIGRDNGDCSWIDIVNTTDGRTLFSRQMIYSKSLRGTFAFSRRLLEIKREKKKRRGERKKETKT